MTSGPGVLLLLALFFSQVTLVEASISVGEGFAIAFGIFLALEFIVLLCCGIKYYQNKRRRGKSERTGQRYYTDKYLLI